MLCPPQYANGPLSRGLAPSAAAEKRSQTEESGFAAFVRRSASATTKLTATNSGSSRAVLGQTSNADALINGIGRSIRSIFATPLDAVHLDTAGQSYAALFESASDLITLYDRGGVLYERLKMEMERAIGSISRSLRGAVENELPAQREWLVRLHAAWTAWQDRTTLIRHVLTLLDQVYLAKADHLLSIEQLSLDLFRHSIAADEELQVQAFKCISAVCGGIRMMDNIHYKSLHKSLLAMFTTLGLYDQLEHAMLSATEAAFSAHAAESIRSLGVAAYVTEAQEQIQREQDNCQWLYMQASGKEKSVALAYSQFYKVHIDALIAAMPLLFDAQEGHTMSLLYDSLQTVKETAKLRAAFVEHIRKEGEAIVLDQANDDKMIDKLLEMKGKIDRMVNEAFKNDVEFQQAQRDTFETFVNKRENKAAELIAKFLDEKLRSGNKTMSDQQMEIVLNEALALFRFTHAKDMFEEFYKRLFAKRLLLNRSASSDAEQSMLLKLKEECGPAFTQKLETMLTDIALSDDMMKAYSASREKFRSSSGDTQDFELSVNVLTQAHWPTYPQVEIIVPADMAAATESFANFYETRNQGRKLQWAHTLGTTSLTAHFAKAGEKELLVSTFQTIVLLLFNVLPAGAKLTYEEIKSQTGLIDKELKRTLQSLACGQIPTRVLRKEPQGKDVDESDVFSVNEHLKNDRKRIRINMIQLTETKEEQKSTVDRVMFDREMVLQATTVRIMKAKKTMKHAELLQEVVQSIAA
jgi:cullin-4